MGAAGCRDAKILRLAMLAQNDKDGKIVPILESSAGADTIILHFAFCILHSCRPLSQPDRLPALPEGEPRTL